MKTRFRDGHARLEIRPFMVPVFVVLLVMLFAATGAAELFYRIEETIGRFGDFLLVRTQRK